MYNTPPPPHELIESFTRTEKKVLSLIIDDELTNKDVANQLHISEKTVKKHKQNICKKLDVCGKYALKKMLKFLAKSYFDKE